MKKWFKLGIIGCGLLFTVPAFAATDLELKEAQLNTLLWKQKSYELQISLLNAYLADLKIAIGALQKDIAADKAKTSETAPKD